MPYLSDQLTVCIFTFNEEKRLERCLRNFLGLFRILVVDNFSSDQTIEVAKSFGCDTVLVRNPGFTETPEVMDRVQESVETLYLLMASVSDFVPFPLLQKYAEIANYGTYDLVLAYRLPITAGQPMRLAGLPGGRSSGQARCFRKGTVDYTGNQVHGVGRITCSEDRILSLILDRQFWFYHIRNYDVSNIERALRGYNDILAQQRFTAGERFGMVKAVGSALKAFLGAYIRGGVYKFGVLGFLHCYYIFHMHMGIWLRVWERENGLDINGVVARNESARSSLEAQFDKDRAVFNSVSTASATDL